MRDILISVRTNIENILYIKQIKNIEKFYLNYIEKYGCLRSVFKQQQYNQ